MKMRILPVLLLSSLLLGGCALQADSGPTPDPRLTGIWTTREDRLRVSLDDTGKPQTDVPVGQWYAFLSNGRYVHIARYMTFAIGGVQVEEGSYASTSEGLTLTGRTRSFFPDEGSPQKAEFRVAEDGDMSLVFRAAEEDGVKALRIRASAEDAEVLYRLCS